jgi:hypothetical protein
VARTTSRRCRCSSSANGALDTIWRAFSSMNTGVSSMLSRTYRPIPISAVLSRKGSECHYSRHWPAASGGW